jgi:hypothetical protein
MKVAVMVQGFLAGQHFAAFGHRALETRLGVNFLDVMKEARREAERCLAVLAFVLARVSGRVLG